jgi:hypothetical protein
MKNITFKHNTIINSNNKSINVNTQKETVRRGIGDNNGLNNIINAQEDCDEPQDLEPPIISNKCEPPDYISLFRYNIIP